MGLDDEAPPLPPRNYNWSDIEDNDDELFQSEDELDDHQWTVSDQQKLYATVSATLYAREIFFVANLMNFNIAKFFDVSALHFKRL